MTQVFEKERKKEKYLYVCPKCGQVMEFERELYNVEELCTEFWYCKRCGTEALIERYYPSKLTIKKPVIVKGEEHAEPYYKYAEKVAANELFTFWCPECGKIVKKPLGRYVCRGCNSRMDMLYSYKRNKVERVCGLCPIRNVCEEKDVICKGLIEFYSEYGRDLKEEEEFEKKYGYDVWYALRYNKPKEYI